ncbi:MAG: enoyl-CoA hydratase-related protein [Acidimicrobiales bacterium]
MPDELLYETRDHVATITVQPARAHGTPSPCACSTPSPPDCWRPTPTRPGRAIVITGNGRFWCAGLDVAETASGGGLGSNQGVTALPGEFDLRNAPPVVLHKIDTPTIAALNGGAAGYGLDLALGCDLRIMAEQAKLAFAFAARGVLPESGGTWLLPRIVGLSVAADLLYRARTLSAAESWRLGLANEVVPAAEANGRSRRHHRRRDRRQRPAAVRAAKRMLRHAATEPLEERAARFLACCRCSQGLQGGDGVVPGEAAGELRGALNDGPGAERAPGAEPGAGHRRGG